MRNKSIILILLVITTFLYSQQYTFATDVSHSTVTPESADIYELQVETITVNSKSASDSPVGGVTVNISASEGTFVDNSKSFIVLTTSSEGSASTEWKAPTAPNDTATVTVTITANFTSGSDISIKTTTITVHPVNFDQSDLTVSPDPVYEMQNATVRVKAEGQHGTISGALVHLECDDGYFPSGTIKGSFTDIVTGDNGVGTAVWKADLSTLLDSLNYVNITANITFSGRTLIYNLSATISVKKMDFNDSTLTASETKVNGGYHVSIVVTTKGSSGIISGATVGLDALDGSFPNGHTQLIGTSNDSGIFETTWTAPDVSSSIDIIISANISFEKTLAFKGDLNVTITVDPVTHNFTINMKVNATSVSVGDLVAINATITNEIGDPVEGALATFVSTEGNFTASGKNTYSINSSVTGYISAVWNTTGLTPTVNGELYPITINLVKEYYNNAEQSINITVNPIILQLVTHTTVDKSTIKQGENVTFSVFVSANGHAVEGATVTIVALSGVFASSGEQTATVNTNSTGYATFTWITKDMTVTKAKNYTFTVSAGMPGYDQSETETITITVNPLSTNPSSNNSLPTTQQTGLPTSTKLIILGGAAGGLILFAAVFYLIKRGKGV